MIALLASAGAIAAAVAPAPSPAAPLTIVALGTSLTARGGWTAPLAAALRTRLGRPVTMRVLARSGATSDWVSAQAPAAVAARPDVVLVEAVANDPALHRRVSLPRSRANLRALLAVLRSARPRPRMIVMAMNPVSGWRRWVRPGLDDYVAAHLEEARRAGAEVLDLRPAWRSHAPRDIPDGLHPSADAAAAVIVPPLAHRIAAIAGKDAAP